MTDSTFHIYCYYLMGKVLAYDIYDNLNTQYCDVRKHPPMFCDLFLCDKTDIACSLGTTLIFLSITSYTFCFYKVHDLS